MYALDKTQCIRTKRNVLEKIIICCECQRIPIIAIRNKYNLNNVYCKKCAFLNNIQQEDISEEDKNILKQLVIDCSKNCGRFFNFDEIKLFEEHEKVCNNFQPINLNLQKIPSPKPKTRKRINIKKDKFISKTNERLLRLENSINETLQTITNNDEKIRKIEKNNDLTNIRIIEISDLVGKLILTNDFNLKKTQEVEISIKNQVEHVKETFSNTFTDHETNFNKVKEDIFHNINLIKKNNEEIFKINQNSEKIRNNEKNEFKLYVDSKFSEFDRLINTMNTTFATVQSDSELLKNNLYTTTEKLIHNFSNYVHKSHINEILDLRLGHFINENKNFHESIRIDLIGVKKTITSSFEELKLKLLEIELKQTQITNENRKDLSMETEPQDVLKIFNFNDLLGIDKSNHILDEFEKIDNKIKMYVNNSILFGNKINIIKNAHPEMINDMVTNIKDNQLISCSMDGSISIWNLKDNTIKKEIKKAHDGKAIQTLLFLDDISLLLSGGSDSMIRFWDNNYDQINFINNITGIDQMIYSNNILIVACKDKNINFFDIGTKNIINIITTNHSYDNSILRILLFRSNDILLTGSGDSNIIIWNIKDFSVKDALKDVKFTLINQGHKGQITSLIQLKYDNEIIVSSDECGTIIFHQINSQTDNNYKFVKKYEISHYDNNPDNNFHYTFLYEVIQHKMLVSLSSYSSLVFWNLCDDCMIIRSIKFKCYLFALIGLENDDAIIFSKFNNDSCTDIIIWK